MKENPLIVALDVSTKEEALSLVKSLKDYVSLFKVGPVLFTRYGPEIVKEIKDFGSNVFLDLKLYDIPNTVAKTVKALKELKIAMFTVHISGGKEMLERAVEALNEKCEKEGERPKIIGVTILTSEAEASSETIVKMANSAKDLGLDGIVCSPREVDKIRQHLGKELVVVTPGIRPSGADLGDQKRVSTPKEALQSGSDYLVIGRPIIKSKDPLQVVKQILADISSL